MSTDQIMIFNKITITRVHYTYVYIKLYIKYIFVLLFYKGLSEYFTRLTYISG